jgi:restriction endonuclease S subunit
MKNWKSNLFTKVFNDVTSQGNKIPQKTFLKPGKIPVIDQGQDFIAGYSNDNSLVWKSDLPVIIFGDHTRAIKYVNFPFILGADGVKVLQPIKEILPLFAYYWLLYIDIPSENYSRHFKFLKELIIKYPPLEEQKRIAKILSKCDRIRRTRQYSLQLSDTYLQSVFLEMFGDPVTNPMGWEKRKLGDLCRIRRGASPRPIEQYLGGEVHWIKIGDGTKGDNLYISSTKDFITNEGAKKSVFLNKNSLIFANCGVSLGFARILKINGCIHDGWLAFDNLDSKLNQIFLLKTLNQITSYFRNLAPDGTQPNLNTEIMSNFLLITPPLQLQEKFAKIVQKFERFRNQQKEAQRQAEHLFQTLLHQAFTGEL